MNSFTDTLRGSQVGIRRAAWSLTVWKEPLKRELNSTRFQWDPSDLRAKKWEAKGRCAKGRCAAKGRGVETGGVLSR